jgi:hypothetical protein
MSDPVIAQEVSNAVQDAPISPSPEQADMVAELESVFGKKDVPLSAAPEPKVEEEPIEEPKKDVDSLKHEIQSWLGRKLSDRDKSYDDKLAEIKEMLSGIVSKKDEPIQPSIEMPDIGEDLDEPIMTKREVLELQERAELAKQKAGNRYWDNFRTELQKLAIADELDPDISDKVGIEIDAILQKASPTKDPLILAQTSYNRALANVYKKATKPQESKLPIKGEKPNSATGVLVSNKLDTKEAQPLQLDAEARRIQAALELSDDTVRGFYKTK